MHLPTIDYFRAIHNSTGLKYAKDAKVVEYQSRFAADFDSSINVEHDVLRNGIPQDFIIVPTRTGCNLWARPGETFNIGDIIYFNTLHWLVTDVNFGDSLNRSGSMVRCNRQIRWQNRKTGKIISRWCLAEKPYSTNVTDALSIGTSNREYKIQLSYDDETMQVDLDRRFLLEIIDGTPRAYKLVSVDTLTNRYEDIDGGFLIWNMEQTEYNPSEDNAELMIADYFQPNEIKESENGKLSCFIEGRTTIREGFSRTYTAFFRDIDSADMNETVEAVWSVQAPTDAVTLVQNGHKAILTFNGGMKPGERIQLSVCDKHGDYEISTFYVEVIEFL